MKNLMILMLVVTCTMICYKSHGQETQIHVEHAPFDGIYIQNPGRNGLKVDTANIGLIVSRSQFGASLSKSELSAILINSAGRHGIDMSSLGHDAINMSDVDSNGIYMKGVGKNGILIDQAARGIDIYNVNEGIRMRSISGNGATIENPLSHGVEVQGAGIHGVRVLNTEANGVDVTGAGTYGIRIQESSVDGLHIEDSGANGLDIFDSERQGLHVSTSGGNGALIYNSTEVGIKVNTTGSHGVHLSNVGTNGIQIDSAGSDGLVIDTPGDDGINIISPADDGITILGGGNDGIHVNGAGNHAGIFINDPGSSNASVLISHGDDTKHDLHLSGNGLMSTENDFTLQLDESGTIANSTFIMRNSDGHAPFIVTEAGDLGITGHLSKGSGSFKIDHPLDPQNKYLYHSFVESPDMMNIYNGNVVLDYDGQARVEMPDWFDALNKDFRYQLTAIGQAADLYIASEMKDRSFEIAGGKPGMKVSWQVTGIRQDKFANANRIEVEVEKETEKKGTYTHPELWQKNTSIRTTRDEPAIQINNNPK